MLQVLIFVVSGLFSAAVGIGVMDEPKAPPAPTSAPAALAQDAQVRYTRAADYSAEHGGRAVLIMVNGKTVFERYDNTWTAQKPHPLASGTKSFVGVVAAAAVEDGLLTWDELACDTLTEWKTDARKSKITVRHLLTLSSGLDPSDAQLGGRGGGRLLGQGATDRAKRLGNQDKPPPADLFDAALDVPMKHDAGARFEYGPSHFYAFGELLQRKLAAKHVADPTFPDTTFESYMHRRVLDAIGLKVGWFAEDKAGNPNLPGGCLLTAREWAKLGELVRLQGKWPKTDETLVSVISWDNLSECFKPSVTNKDYGLTWWLPTSANPEASLIADGALGEILRRRNKSQASPRMLGPDGEPLKVYMAAGLGKQRLYVIPAYDLVVVRFAEATREGRRYDDREFLTPILGGAQGVDKDAIKGE